MQLRFSFYGLWDFRVVLQQNGRFSEMEEKFKFLHGKTSSLLDMEEKVLKVSHKVSLHCCIEWNFVKGLIHHLQAITTSTSSGVCVCYRNKS